MCVCDCDVSTSAAPQATGVSTFVHLLGCGAVSNDS